MELQSKILERHSTFKVMPAPNHTSPETFKLSSSTMLGIDLKRLKKLATCKGNKFSYIYKEMSQVGGINLNLFELRSQFNCRIRRICPSWISDHIAIIREVVQIRLLRPNADVTNILFSNHGNVKPILGKIENSPGQEGDLMLLLLEGIEIEEH